MYSNTKHDLTMDRGISVPFKYLGHIRGIDILYDPEDPRLGRIILNGEPSHLSKDPYAVVFTSPNSPPFYSQISLSEYNALGINGDDAKAIEEFTYAALQLMPL
jgi:hypothetical protein